MKSMRKLIIGVLVLLVAIWFGYVAFKWTVMRVYVPSDKALLVINKFGKDLPVGRITVPANDNQYKGVREEVLGPGRYFLNPVEYDWKLVDLVEIPAGEPQKWDFDPAGYLKDPRTAPMVGLVTMNEGNDAPPGQVVVKPGFKGIQEEVLAPGTYKINQTRMKVTPVPAVIVPPGSVGVVTRLVGDVGEVSSATLMQIHDAAKAATTQPGAPIPTRLVSGPTQRGILKDVLQPGIYYLNPRMIKVTIMPVGYDEVTLDHASGSQIKFYSNDGYLIEAEFTVVWGRTPTDAPNIVASIGTTEKVEQNVILPAVKAACQNEGATYNAIELIQGKTRSEFQDKLHDALKKQVAPRNLDILLTLVRNLTVIDKSGKDATEGLLATIQRANIEIERDLTNKQKTETAVVAAQLQQALKLVDVARETVASESNVLVADTLAKGQKAAAEIDAQRDVDVAQVNLQIAQLDAQRVEIMGKATAQVEQLRNDAEAKGAKMLVDALGSPAAYNKYIFAKNFEPRELKLIFAGPGTFWTDLKSFQEIGATRIIQQSQDGK